MLSEIVILFLICAIGGMIYDHRRLEAKITSMEAAGIDSAKAFIEIGTVFQAMLKVLPEDQVAAMDVQYKKLRETMIQNSGNQ